MTETNYLNIKPKSNLLTPDGTRFKKSAVWNFIVVENNRNSTYGLCKICNKDVYRGNTASTTPFWRHIHKEH